ncbi:MAG: transporter substrate-binding domain-containing protein [Phyllobacteriaceae bacterium]|nr:transporter substrate-binding domain-containing protein [Phyllobacteriaceae bacterium]
MIASLRTVVALGIVLTVSFGAGGPLRSAEPAAPEARPATASDAANAPFRPLFWDPDNRPPKPAGETTTIRFLVTGDFPPFSFLDATGRLIGYDVDLARVLCEELNASCSLQMRPFADLVPALLDKRGDAILAGLAVGADLRDRIDTTDAYLGTPGRFVTQRDETLEATPEGLAGRWIAVVSGSAHERFVLSRFPAARVAAFPDESSARDALRDRKVSAHFGDAIGLSYWLAGEASHGCCVFSGGAWLEPAVFGEGLRIDVAKANTRLKRHLDWALRKAATEGRLGELYLRWFPLSYY